MTTCVSTPASALPKCNPSILLAEDDDDEVFLFKMAVLHSKNPVEVIRAYDAKEAVDYIKTKSECPPNVIVTDLKMPGGNGFDLLTELKSNPTTAKIPSVILTVSEAPADKARGEALGAADYFVKSKDPNLMIELIEQIYQRFFRSCQNSNFHPPRFPDRSPLS